VIRQIFSKHAEILNLDISEMQIEVFARYAAELNKWNRKINLTALTSDEDIAIKHLIDSCIAAEYVKGAIRLLDVGSGAGIPSIPLKIMFPDTKIVSVDTVGKKIMFQRHVARLLKLDNFEAIHSRVETMAPEYAGSFDVIISRAFSRLDTFVALVAPLLADGGRVIAMKGPAADEESIVGTSCNSNNGLRVSAVNTYFLPQNKGERRIVIISADKAR
jgi:16S rRNA (guanine527-N7)-methyltransferase